MFLIPCTTDENSYVISSVIRRSFFSFLNNSKNLDPSYKTDLNLWDCGSRSLGIFRNGETRIIAKFHRTDCVTCSHSREGKTPSYSRVNR